MANGNFILYLELGIGGFILGIYAIEQEGRSL